MTGIDAVIFDWGGTLSPWHDISLLGQWYAYANVYDPAGAGNLAMRLVDAEIGFWQSQHHSAGAQGTGELTAVFEACGIDLGTQAHRRAFEAYLKAWEPHTYADPDAIALFEGLRARGLKIGILSNTMWPRWFHEAVFERDGLLAYVDGAIYSSELPVGKPHPDAFNAALAAVGASDPARVVFVGDRLWDDIHGAARVGMRTIFIPHSAIPADQLGPDEGQPDGVAVKLGDVLTLVDSWLPGKARG